MKAVYLHAAGAIALTFSIAACVPQAAPPAPTPAPVAQPTPTPAPAPPIVREPVYENYLDAPQTPGSWHYVVDGLDTRAIFARSETEPLFGVSCILRRGADGLRSPTIKLSRAATGGGERVMQITTETVTRNLASSAPSRRMAMFKGMDMWDHMSNNTNVDLDPRDPLLDAMAITKGRFAVSVEGERTLYLPAWVEVSRVIEDCR